MCPECNKGRLGPLQSSSGPRKPHHRCNNGKTCGKRIELAHCHPVFVVGSGHTWQSLGQQAAVVFCIVSGCTSSSVRKLLGLNHKVVERVNTAMQSLQRRHVERAEWDIQFCDGKQWVDVEADETVFRKQRVCEPGGKCNLVWEQWAGCVERGRPETLVLWRTQSNKTVLRAPGPGAIKKSDCKPFAHSRLANRKVILHGDGARTYRMRAPWLLHDALVHKKKKINGVWVNPKYVTIKKHRLPCGKLLTVKGGPNSQHHQPFVCCKTCSSISFATVSSPPKENCMTTEGGATIYIYIYIRRGAKGVHLDVSHPGFLYYF